MDLRHQYSVLKDWPTTARASRSQDSAHKPTARTVTFGDSKPLTGSRHERNVMTLRTAGATFISDVGSRKTGIGEAMAVRGVKAKIDLVELQKLCHLQCTDEEIAAWFNVATRTIERRRKNPKFAAVMERGRAQGRISVRRMQMRLLEQGNATMGVWLGKQILGQTDIVDYRGDIAKQTFLLLLQPKESQVEPAVPPSIERGAAIDIRPAGVIE